MASNDYIKSVLHQIKLSINGGQKEDLNYVIFYVPQGNLTSSKFERSTEIIHAKERIVSFRTALIPRQ